MSFLHIYIDSVYINKLAGVQGIMGLSTLLNNEHVFDILHFCSWPENPPKQIFSFCQTESMQGIVLKLFWKDCAVF